MLLSTLTLVDAASAEVGAQGVATVLQLRSAETGVAVETYAVIDNGAVFAPSDALRQLGLKHAPNGDLVPLSDVPGLTVRLDVAAGEAVLSCPLVCYLAQTIGGETAPRDVTVDAGAFLNSDLALSAVGQSREAAGAFEMGVFGAFGQAELSWTVGARGSAEAVRLETRWTFDDPARRVRYRIGDSIARTGATGAPYRFGGLQVARDFSLDPRFVTFPTPNLGGLATAPSVVDLYVDGALRLRERVDAGPFTIVDPPVVTGAGQAQIVVTDALGRQQVTSAPFYTSRALLKPGLSDFAAAVGAVRENYSTESADYGDGFISGLYRRGLTSALTAEVRGEAMDGLSNVGAGVSWTPNGAGQFDLAIAASESAGADGALTRFGYAHFNRSFSIGAEIERASVDFARIGVDVEAPRTRAAVSLGGDTGVGSASLSMTVFDYRHRADVRTVALDYNPTLSQRASVGLTLLYVEAESTEMSVAARLVRRLGNVGNFSAVVENRAGEWSSGAGVYSPAPPGGGIGWRAAAHTGSMERRQAAMRYDTLRGVFDLEASRVSHTTGVRAQAAFGLAWIDGGLYASRPIRESFALVDAQAPGVTVTRDNRRAGVTNEHGRVLVTDLRPYENNRLGIEIEDLPTGIPVAYDAVVITPGARSGAIVRFPVQPGSAGEVHVLDNEGAPLPRGAMLIRESDGARFPVGDDGRVYVEGVRDIVVLKREGAAACTVRVAAEAVASGGSVACRRGAG